MRFSGSRLSGVPGKGIVKTRDTICRAARTKTFLQGRTIASNFFPDFICHESIIIELKALASTTGEHKAQVMNYLKATGLRLGLLVNFGCYPKATVERIVL